MLLSAVCNGKVPCVLCDRMLTFLRLLFHLRKPSRFRHALVQHCSAVPADDILHSVVQASVSAEGYDGLVLLPVDPQVIRSSAVGTMGRRGSAAVFSLGILSNLLRHLTGRASSRSVSTARWRRGSWGNWSMRRRMMEPLWMTANQEPTVSRQRTGGYRLGVLRAEETKAAQSSTAPPWWLL